MDFYSSGSVNYNTLVSRWEKDDAYMSNKLDRLFTMYEMVKYETEQIHRDIETKIYVEGGTFDDLDYLYTEAEEQNNQQKVTLLTKIINFFKNIIAKIREKITSLFGGNEDVDVEVPKEQLGMIDRIIEHFRAIKAAFSKILSGNILSGLVELGNAAKFEFVAAGTVAVYATISKSKLKEKYKVLQDINDTIDNCLNRVDGFMKKNIKEGGILDKLINGVKDLREKFGDIINAAVNAAGEWLDKAKALIKGKKTGANNENGNAENNPEGNGTEGGKTDGNNGSGNTGGTNGNTNNAGENNNNTGNAGTNNNNSGNANSGNNAGNTNNGNTGSGNNSGNKGNNSGNTNNASNNTTGNNGGNNNSGNTDGNGSDDKLPYQTMSKEELEDAGLDKNGKIVKVKAFIKYMINKGLLNKKQLDTYNKYIKNGSKNAMINFATTIRHQVHESYVGFWDDDDESFYEDYKDDSYGFWN